MVALRGFGWARNDFSQYPVFPWVLADYSSPQLNLEEQSSEGSGNSCRDTYIYISKSEGTWGKRPTVTKR